jgi:hypothetical protein
LKGQLESALDGCVWTSDFPSHLVSGIVPCVLWVGLMTAGVLQLLETGPYAMKCGDGGINMTPNGIFEVRSSDYGTSGYKVCAIWRSASYWLEIIIMACIDSDGAAII